MNKFILIIAVLFCNVLVAQDSLVSKKNISITGYLKELTLVRYDNIHYTNLTFLTHNRMNISWKPSKDIIGKLEIRSRMFIGDEVKNTPDFKTKLTNQNDFIPLSLTLINQNNNCLFSNVERLSIEYRKKNWNIRAGRQRINWGVNTFWNPNDIFNTYNFFDFDYEERPGSDAIKIQLLHKHFSNTEIAFSVSGKKPITAVKYFTNYKKYDLQFIIGSYKNIFTAGFGWAGHISNIGYKGEIQFYNEQPKRKIIFSTEADYVFKKGWYLSSGFLYHQNKNYNADLSGSLLNYQSSPLQLMPFTFNYIINASKEITPLFKIKLGVMYTHDIDVFMIFPSLQYNLKTNLDIDFISQSVMAKFNGVKSDNHFFILRLKWNF